MRYEIWLEGLLGNDWAEWLGAMALIRESGNITLLICSVPDQAALFGLLRRMHDLGMPLLAVYRIPDIPWRAESRPAAGRAALPQSKAGLATEPGLKSRDT